jgi:3-oxoacyl-[acyl-carrier protein] reductase
MDLGLAGRSALVTAGSAGLGFASARALVEDGATVAICARGAERLAAAVESLRGTGKGNAVGFVGDVSNPDEPERIVREAERAIGPISILVVNAGGPRAGSILDLSEGDWTAAYHLTLMSAVRLARAALPGMLDRRDGRIVFITSTSVKQPIGDLLLSNVFRAGVTGLAKSLASEFGARGLRVNSVCPGPYETDRITEVMTARAEKAGTTVDEERRRHVAGVSAGRFGQPIEMGRVVAFLASDTASYINGSAISVDGGTVKGIFG